MKNRPTVVVIGGPNGAGKSTTAPFLLRDLFNIATFVNADTIASGLSGFSPDQVALKAGRIMLERVKELGQRGESFAFETTLAGRNFASFLTELKTAQSYHAHVLFMWLRNEQQAISRVQERVRGGGHAVPVEVIRRRYQRGLHNFFNLYEPIADSWTFVDNSGPQGPQTIACKKPGGDLTINDEDLWLKIKEQADD